MENKTGFVFTDDILQYDYGPLHPMKVVRLRLARDLITACGLLDETGIEVTVPGPADRDEVLGFHGEEYVAALESASAGEFTHSRSSFGLAPGDNPAFEGVYEFSLLSAGGSIEAARMVAAGRADRVFHIAGGLHHAHRHRASGFCYLNDPVLAILELLNRDLRVAYIDVDAHHGDGVQWAFYDTDRVLTVSLHQDGRTLFPGTGAVDETGRGAGEGYAVNIPLWPGTGDELFRRAFREIVVPVIEWYRPDVVVTQLGVDAFRDDPLALLELSTRGFQDLLEMMRDLFPRWVALGGGGYDLKTVACEWTRVWALISGQEPDDEIEKRYPDIAAGAGIKHSMARTPRLTARAETEQAGRYLEAVLDRIKQMLHSFHQLPI